MSMIIILSYNPFESITGLDFPYMLSSKMHSDDACALAYLFAKFCERDLHCVVCVC